MACKSAGLSSCVVFVWILGMAAPSPAEGQGLTAGTKVKFVDNKGETHYGTVREITSERGEVVSLDGKPVKFRTEEIVSYRSTGETRDIQPVWSSSKLTKPIYELVLLNGEVVHGGWLGNVVWWIDGTDGVTYRNGGSGFLSIESVDTLPLPTSNEEEDSTSKARLPDDLERYSYLVRASDALVVHMDESGRGYVHDGKRDTWVKIPPLDRLQPAYTKISNTMVLFYGIGSASVYDIGTGTYVNLPSHRGRTFSGFSRTETRGYAAQCNDNLAMAAGTVWSGVYDCDLHRWVLLSGGADDSTRDLGQNLILDRDVAYIQVLNDRLKAYRLGSGRFMNAVELDAAGGRPDDLSAYLFRVLGDRDIRLYMDEMGRGYVYDSNRDRWLPVPVLERIQPYYAKTSNTLALIYSQEGVSVYDSAIGDFATLESHQGRAFAPFTRTQTRDFAAQCNDTLALAAGTAWSAVYDGSLHSWFILKGGADDSTSYLPRNLVLRDDQAIVKVLNGDRYVYAAGSKSFEKTTESSVATTYRPCEGDGAHLVVTPPVVERPPGSTVRLPPVSCELPVTGKKIALDPRRMQWRLIHGPATLIGDEIRIDLDAKVGTDDVLVLVTYPDVRDRETFTVLIRERR